MIDPFGGIKTFHNAFRKDVAEIDEAVYDVAANGGDLSPVLDRLQLFSLWLGYHARGEDVSVLPALDRVVPHVAKAYEIDHRELEVMAEALKRIMGARDERGAARAMTALTTHLTIHLAKEDVHMYPLLREATSADEQFKILDDLAAVVPGEDFPALLTWFYGLAPAEERAVMTELWLAMMGEDALPWFRGIARDCIASGGWADLTRRLPALA